MGCIHYSSSCEIQGKCCDSFFNCFRCHDLLTDHEFDRSCLKSVKCTVCDTIQEPSSQCIKCNTTFATYVCLKCSLFTNSTESPYIHCDQCGFCCKGTSSTIRHCTVCDTCYLISQEKEHLMMHDQVWAPTKESKCLICSKNIIYSPHQSFKCSHCHRFMHLNCLILLIHFNQGICECGKLFIEPKIYNSILSDPFIIEGLKTLPLNLHNPDEELELELLKFIESL